MLKGCAKAGWSDGGGSVAGRCAGGNFKRDDGSEVILTDAAEVVMTGLRQEVLVSN